MLQEYYGQKNFFINLKSIKGINLIVPGLEKHTKLELLSCRLSKFCCLLYTKTEKENYNFTHGHPIFMLSMKFDSSYELLLKCKSHSWDKFIAL